MLFKHRKKYNKKKLKNCLIHTINILENSHHSFMCIFEFQTNFFFYNQIMLYHSALNVQEIGKNNNTKNQMIVSEEKRVNQTWIFFFCILLLCTN